MSDWNAQTADRIEQLVTTVRARTVGPAETASRAIVFGVLTASFAGTAAVLVSVMGFRLLALGLPTWAAWLVLGGIFIAAGVLCWVLRHRALKEIPGD